MIRQYDMASNEPLDNTERDGESLQESPAVEVGACLETIDTALKHPGERRGTIPADLIQLDVEAFLRRQR